MGDKNNLLVERLRKDIANIFSPERSRIWKYYGLTGFDDDGYPLAKSKLLVEIQVAHPMYGAYLIVEFLNLHQNSQGDNKFLEYAILIARASIGRMTEKNDSLCFL